ncbi:gliding motility-associated C-terminal domain-containing protein [Pedobacter sp. N36a]|uniref:MBG domain-containing protein n=1 Tax=Pedobacter sp. N36a TaxID=2767996 RepID=UPI00165757B3|nr:MBG domain-containing protein [Pedobacter sp. N36a]MBC8986199.1 gliding motility-associated C-terminal domain-containing protein [Pedobacter sp. N36a]
MKKLSITGIAALFLLMLCSFIPKNSTAQITAGDFAIVGFNPLGQKAEISIMALKEIPAGTEIKITDNAYQDGIFRTNSTDGILTWTSPAAAVVSAGTVIRIEFNNTSATITPNLGTASVTTGWILGDITPLAGDSWIIYTDIAGVKTYIYALGNWSTTAAQFILDPNTGWVTSGLNTGSGTSQLPPGLASANAYVTITNNPPGKTHQSSAYNYYKGTLMGNKTTLLAAINNADNWMSDKTTLTPITPGITGAFPGVQPIFTIVDGPFVTSVSTTASAGLKPFFTTIPITISFSENVTVTGYPRLKLNVGNNYANYVSGTGSQNLRFEYLVFTLDSSTDLDYENINSLSLNSGTIIGAASKAAILTLPAPGTPNALGGRGISVDLLSPTVSSVNTTIANGSYATGKVIPVTVNFSEAVTVTGTPTLLLNTSGTPLNYLSGSGTSTLTFEYTVLAGQSTAALNYANTAAFALNGGTIRDAAANVATLTLPNPSMGLTGPSGKANIIIDTTSPTVTSVSGTNGTYKIGSIVPISLTFSEPITVTGTPLLALNVGSPAGNASYASGSGTSTLTFNYTVAEEQSATDLDYTSTTALSLNGGTLKDAAGNNATLTLASPGTAGSLAANSSIVINGTPPTVSSINRTTAAVTNASSVNFTVTFSEAISGIDITDFSLISTGIVSPSINSLTGSGTTYTVTVNTGTGNGTLRLDLNAAGTGIVGTSSGNAIQTGYTAGQTYTIDKTPPVAMAGPILTAGDQQLVLDWTASPTANSYKIYGGTTTTTATALFQTLSGSTLSYTHTGLTNGSTYYYAISAVDQAGNESMKSVTTSGTPKASQTITFSAPAPQVYGSSFDLTASSTSLLPVTFSSSNIAIATVSGNTVTIVGVGAVNITASQAGNANFVAATPVIQSLQITPLPVTVTATASSKIFGNPEPLSFGFSISPALIGTDTKTGALARVAGENAGSYEIGIGTFALDPLKYTITYAPANFSISKKIVTINPVVNTKVYNQIDPRLSFLIDVPAVPVTGALARTAGEDVGSYDYDISGMTVGSNYQLALTPTPKFSITPLTINVTASATTKAYGDADPILAYTATPALKSGDSFTGALARAAGESVGAYALNRGDLALSSNYLLNFITPVNTFSITKKTITVVPVAVAKVYGEPIVPATYNYSPALAIGDSFNGNLTVPTAGPAGDHDFNIGTLTLSGNYTLVFAPAAIKYSISKKPLTITPDANQGRVFGAAALPITYSNSALASGDVLTGELAIAGGTNAGDHAITLGTLSMADGKIINYEVSLAPENYNISQKAIVLTAASLSKTYGEADPTLTYTSSAAPIAPDAFAGTLGRAPGTNVGSYAINLGSLALNNNYTLTLAPGASLEIVKKDISVLAEAKSKVYGGTDPELTYTSSPALVIGDTFSGALSRAAGEEAGAYVIGKGDLALSSNYNLNYSPANLTIGLQTINVTAKAKAKIYGEADPALEYDFTPALKSGDTFSGSLSRTAGENVGSYVIGKGDLALSSNYTLNYSPANLIIGLQTINVTAKAKTKIYGEADPALDYEFTPALKSGDVFIGALSRAAGENVSTYAIGKGDLALNSNYILNYTPANLTIGQQTINVTAKAKTKVYGEADPALDYEFSPALKSGDVFTGSLSRAAGETVNTYVIGKGDLALNSNYILNYTPANLTITLKTINVTAKAKTKVYGGTDPELTYTSSPALVIGDTFSGALSRAAGEEAGAYVIGKGDLALSSNYNLNYSPANLTIGLKTIEVTAKVKTKVYGEADPALEYDFTPALKSGDEFTGALSRAAGEDVGTYAIGKGDLALSSNYTLNYTPANLTIGLQTINVTAKAKAKIYGEADPALEYDFTPALTSGDTFSGTLSRAAGENVGSYVIGKGDLALSSNYTLNYSPANLIIGLQTINVTAKAKTKIYGEADPAFDYDFTPALKSGDVFTGALSRAAGENVNTYAIGKGDLALNSNYILNYTPANLTIGQQTIEVSAKAKTKVYGEADPALDYEFSPALKSGDVFTGSLSRAAGETVNTYVIGKGDLALNSNYILNYTPANLTITLKTINVTAKAKTKVYGEADPALDYDFTPALKSGDSFTGSLSRTAGTSIGNYVIGQGNLALNANYTLAYTPANLSITAKAIAVQAVAKSKTYGNADPLLTYTVTPALVNGDALSGTLSRASGENKGTYAISKGSLASSTDYTLSFTNADFTINAAPLTITAEAKEKFTGTANPTFTAQYTGYVNGEDNTVLTSPVVFNTPATINSPIGTYDIIPSGAAAVNYSITFVKGVLTVKAGSPTNVLLAAATLYENQVSGTAAGKLSSTSDDPLATFTYSLVSGTGDTDNAAFRIAGDQLLTAASLDYETKKVYSVKVKSTTQHGFSLDKTFSINLSDVNEIPTLDAIASKTICYTTNTQTIDLTGISAGPESGQNTTVTVSGSNAALLQSLTVAPGSGGKAILSYRVKNGASGISTITVTVKDNGGTDNGGVDTYSRTFVLTVNALPVIAINANIGSNNNSSSTEVSKGETLVLTASGGSTYVWAVHNSIISGQTSASLTVRPRETTTYTVTVTNANGCSEQKSFTVNVLDDLVKIKATNILTPNGDGYNDKWIIENIDFYPNNEVKIFDQSGRMVYGKRSYDNSWDGMLNGMPLAEGTYYYVIDFGKDRQKFKGFITIVREN